MKVQIHYGCAMKRCSDTKSATLMRNSLHTFDTTSPGHKKSVQEKCSVPATRLTSEHFVLCYLK
jgi:hypothetical protein